MMRPVRNQASIDHTLMHKIDLNLYQVNFHTYLSINGTYHKYTPEAKWSGERNTLTFS